MFRQFYGTFLWFQILSVNVNINIGPYREGTKNMIRIKAISKQKRIPINRNELKIKYTCAQYT